MMQVSDSHSLQPNRILELDGLRGFAIILVILNHFRFTALYTLTPQWLHPIIALMINNGKLGVCLLFMLSGYLMATLYPHVPSSLKFWQKRYARIMPSFVAMCIALGIIRPFWVHLSNFAVILIVVIVLMSGGGIWRWLQTLENREVWGKRIFLLFLSFQLLSALFYLFVLSRVPGSVFYLVWPAWRSQVLTALGNITLVLPFGQYLPQLDGAYWSIISEMYFYLLYPLVLLPITHVAVRQKNKLVNWVLLVSLFPFLYGLSLLSKSLLGFHMIQIHLIVYFIFGILLGFFHHEKWINHIQSFFQRIPKRFTVITVFSGIIGLSIFQNYFSLGFEGDTLLWVFPMSLSFIIVLSKPLVLRRILANPVITKLGEYSFALYLTHTIAIEMFVRAKDPQTAHQLFSVTLMSIVVMWILSVTLHWSLELPYFRKSVVQKKSRNSAEADIVIRGFLNLKRVFALLVVLMCCVWYAFRIPVKLTALVVNHRDSNYPLRTILTADPVTLHFTGAYQKLGMILLSVKPLDDGLVKELGLTRGKRTDTDLVVSLIKEPNTLLNENRYPLYQIFESHFHPVGLPIEEDSSGKNIDVMIRISDKDTNQQLSLINNGVAFRSVYFLSKTDLITHPRFLVDLIIQKAFLPFLEPQAQEILLLSAPFYLILTFLVFVKNLQVKK